MKQQQRGGTILGFIIGVVVGLGAALIVAVYVTKVPVPFLNKGQSRSVEQDEAEARRNKGWEPNAPLQGKSQAKAVAPAAPTAPAAVEASAPPVPGQSVKGEIKPAVTADPLGDLAKAKAGGEPFTYFVQVGAFRTPEDAESQRARLSLGGVEAKVQEREQSGRMVYRVRIGPFDKREDAEKAKDKLSNAGHETALVRVQR